MSRIQMGAAKRLTISSAAVMSVALGLVTPVVIDSTVPTTAAAAQGVELVALADKGGATCEGASIYNDGDVSNDSFTITFKETGQTLRLSESANREGGAQWFDLPSGVVTVVANPVVGDKTVVLDSITINVASCNEDPQVDDGSWVYMNPGTFHVNGRDWRTTCEPYSQTERCRTEIWSTQVNYVNGKLVKQTGWHFNNLTYLPSSRSLWKENRLGYTNHWISDEYVGGGRFWRTECDTALTGRNGCRSFIWATVVVATLRPDGTYAYTLERDREVFNNIVMFK